MKALRMVVIFSLLAMISAGVLAQDDLRKREQDRRKKNEQFDTYNLRSKREFVVDSSKEFLKVPDGKKPKGTYSIAKTPPEVKLMICPDMEPEYFDDMAEAKDAYMICWANWAYVSRSYDNRFFCSVSNHRGYGCQINLYEYNPGRNTFFTTLDVDELLGWNDHTYTDGKINTHEAINWGVPMVGSNLPCFTVDTARGRLVASGAFNMVLSWDCIGKKVRYAGCPPNGWFMWQRSMLLDEETGKMWSVDSKDDQIRFMSFDPEGAGGKPEVELVGATWDEGRDTLQMGISPKGRYIYYYPKGDSPVVQYDVRTGRMKALCFLQEYYFGKYGYWMDHVYGMEISKDGSFLVVSMNGAFQGRDVAFGHPSLLVISIPEEERVE